MAKNDKDFVTIRIKRVDHERLTKYVTYDVKLHDVVTKAVDSLEGEVIVR